MNCDILSSLKKLSDAELVGELKTLVGRERGATALLVAHLAEMDTRDIFLREGYSSLFAYCREALGLSDHEALNRIEAARAARRFPAILEMLTAGSVHLTAVRLLAPHLTADNYAQVLMCARGKTTEQIREMVAASSPRPDAPTSVRRLPAPPSAVISAAALPGASPPGVGSAPQTPMVATEPTAPVGGFAAVGGAATVAPLAPDRYRLLVTIDGDTLEKLRLAKDMLSHALPGGDDAAVLDRALDQLLSALARARFAATDRPRQGKGTGSGTRHIPAEVKRTVWVRDLGRCAFVGSGGHRCTQRAFLEFHHVKPYEVGGAATVANIELRCGRHNRYEAKVYFERSETPGAGIRREVGLR
jgi:hypothetical protein